MSVSKMLKGHELFRALSVDEMNHISTFSSTKNFAAGATIFRVDAAPSHVFLLLEGQVHLRLPANPPEFGIVVSKIEKGEMFGLSSLLGSSRYTTSAQCEAPTEVLVIEAKPLEQLLQANTVTGYHIMSQVAQVYFARYMEVLRNLQGVVSQVALIH